MLLRVMVPVVGGRRASRREARVDLPEPEGPTRAVVMDGWMARDREAMGGWVGRVG